MIITFLNILLLSVNADYYSWSLDRINQKYLIPDFHFFNTNHGYNTTVYVIDSGFTNNTLFYDNIILTESFIDDNSTDTLGHGTHVISLISSKDYGVSKNVDIVGLKVFNDTHNTTAIDLINALNFSQDHCMNHSNKCIINLSLGLTTIVEEVDDLLNDIYNDDFIIVVAAGNDDINSCLRSPSHLDFVITVGSINYFDFKSSFSNYGSCVDLYTYGEFIPGLNLNNNVILKSGTSMSAPIVTGFIANLWSQNLNLNNEEIMDIFYDEYLLVTKKDLDILYTSENEYNPFLIFIPIFLSYLFFKISLLICCCNKC